MEEAAMTERSTGFVATNRAFTAEQAADLFAAKCWEQPRKISRWEGGRFQLVQGVAWYEPRMCPHGWEIWRIDS
jgi:hypothetical protein